LAYAYHYYQRWSERQSAMSACESSYQEGDHESVVAACLELSEEGVADAANVLNRSRQRESEREAAEKEAERLAREEAARKEAERLAREEAAKKEAERLAREEAAKKEAERLAREEAARKEAERLAREEAEKEEAERLKAGRAFRDCDVCPEMVVVPPGSYRMGSPPSEQGRDSDEGPAHQVNIAYSFAVGVHEVTFEEWDACVAGGGCNGHTPGDRGWGRGQRPVIDVSWEDAQSYLQWLSGKAGKSYRLLSESEWEYVARAGTTTPFHYGSTISTEQANYNGNYTYGSGGKGVSRGKTVAAGSFPPNAFGLHDVHGNVWEWVQDCVNVNYQGAPDNGSAWESGDCSRRVLRGGSWDLEPWLLRSANRGGNAAGNRNYSIGFRVARTLTP